MFQDNPLLAQLKQKIQDNKPKVEGVVRGSDKSYGFLECENKKSYFLPPPAMKKVMHGDKIRAAIESSDGKEQAEPLELIEPMLSRFIAKVRFNKEGKLQLLVDHPQIKQVIGAKKAKKLTQELQAGDWVVAQLKSHPLRDDRFLFAEVTAFICHEDDEFAPWWVTLAKHEQSRYPVDGAESYQMLDTHERADLTALHFVTIDSETTQDMDDALYLEARYDENAVQNGWKLVVAIADPTAYIAEDSHIEKSAKQRCFTNYLPGFNIPMLPRELADDLCSLTPNDTKAALVCTINTNLEGEVMGDVEFTSAYIQSKAKLAYDKVSDYLEGKDNAWQAEDEKTQEQIDALHAFTKARIQWRQTHSLLFKESADFDFELAENGKVLAIHASYRRIANKIVEEAMILANSCAAIYLAKNIGCGIFNTHVGFDSKNLPLAKNFLLEQLSNEENQAELSLRYSEENLATLAGYCQMRHDLEKIDTDYLEMRLRRFLTFAEFKAELAPHFGLGLSGYATWTSPIRKYSDMVNHRLIKGFLTGKQEQKAPEESVLMRLQEARRQNRLVERDIADWLYCRYLAQYLEQKPVFEAVIQDIMRGGMRVQLVENGASIFVPASTISTNRDDLVVNSDEIALYIQGEKAYKIGDSVQIRLTDVREDTRSLIGELAQ